MIYDAGRLSDLIERLQTIQEYDYINYPPEDERRVRGIMEKIEEQVIEWEKMQNDNYSY